MTYFNQISETVTDQVQHSPVGRACDFMLGRGSSRLAAWMSAVLESGSEPAALPNDSVITAITCFFCPHSLNMNRLFWLHSLFLQCFLFSLFVWICHLSFERSGASAQLTLVSHHLPWGLESSSTSRPLPSRTRLQSLAGLPCCCFAITVTLLLLLLQ